MPVRSSLCTYSPMMAASGSGAMPGGRSSSSASSKYSSILPTSSPLSYGHYKPLSSASSNYSSPVSSSSSSSTSTLGRYNRLSSAYSPSSYSPSSSSSLSTASTSSSSSSPSSSSLSNGAGAGLYKPLSSTRAGSSWRTDAVGLTSTPSSSRYTSGTSPRYSSSSSTGSLTSTSSSGSSGERFTGSAAAAASTYQPFKSSSSSSSSGLSTSAYSSGSSLSSSSSTSPYSSSRQSRRFSTDHHALTATAAQAALPADAPSGLMNLGNTCYMNASLQALYSIESFRNLLLSSTVRHSDRPLTNELADLFRLMKETSSIGGGSAGRGSATSSPSSSVTHQQPLSPANFKFAFARHQNKFSGFGQQDAQEFLRYLIDGIHEECNAATRRPRRQPARSTSSTTASPKSAHEAWAQYREIVDDSPLVELLVGQLQSTITCCECRNKSHCWDPFWDLSLPLLVRGRGATGNGGSGGSGGSLCSWRSYYSSSSSSPSASSASSRLSDVIEEFTSQEILDSDERPICSQCKRPTKSTKQISLARLPRVLILHLKKFTNDGYKLTSPEIQIDKQLTFNGTSHYQLKACISHHGHSSSSGHYTSHCEYASRWLHFDDGRVRDVTSSFDCGKLDDAYVLFYTQQHQRSRSPVRNTNNNASSISQSKL